MKKRILFWSLILILVIGGSTGQTVFAGVTACYEAELCHNFTDCTNCTGNCGGSITYTYLYGDGDEYHTQSYYEGVCNRCGNIRHDWVYYTKGVGSTGDTTKDERVYTCTQILSNPGDTICGGSYGNYVKTSVASNFCGNSSHPGHMLNTYNWSVTCSECGNVKTGSYTEKCGSNLWSEPKYTAWKCTSPKPCPNCDGGKIFTTCTEHGRKDYHAACDLHNWIGTPTFCSAQTLTCTLPVKCTAIHSVETKCSNCDGTGKITTSYTCPGTISLSLSGSKSFPCENMVYSGGGLVKCGATYTVYSYTGTCSSCGAQGGWGETIGTCSHYADHNLNAPSSTSCGRSYGAGSDCTNCNGTGKITTEYCDIHNTGANHYVCDTHNWWGTTTTHKYCEHGKASEHCIHYIFEASASDMITEWNILTENTTITLPVRNGGNASGQNVTVDWGDGSAVQTVTTEFPTHKYTTAGTYNITVSGTCQIFGYASSSSVNTTSSYYTMSQYLVGVKQLGELGTMQYGFSQCENLTYVSGENLVASNTFKNVVDMSYMFYNCTNLTNLDVSRFDTSKVSSMSDMFYNCNKLTSLDVRGFDTSNVINMYYVFYKCSNLTTLDVSGFDTRNVGIMSYMFGNCNNLTTLDVSNWDTTNVAQMIGVFYNCNSLKTLDMSNWDTTQTRHMGSMFLNCTGLRSIQVNNKFVVPPTMSEHEPNNENMFSNTPNLTAIITISETPLSGQPGFTNVKTQIDGKTIYVPSKTAETAYETAWSADFTADRIEPILQLIGNATVEINQGTTYTDAGYTVAGFDTSGLAYYTPYGYSVAKSGTVNTAVPGTYNLTYTISRKSSNLMNVVRTVKVIRTTIDISTLTATLPSTTYEYTGTAITPEPTVKDGATTLTKGTDYTVSYSNNINAGTATVTITGKGGYTGTKTLNFTITKKKISVPTQRGILTYNGASQTPTWNNFDSKWIEIEVTTSTTSAINAGDYTVEFILKDPANTEWAD